MDPNEKNAEEAALQHVIEAVKHELSQNDQYESFLEHEPNNGRKKSHHDSEFEDFPLHQNSKPSSSESYPMVELDHHLSNEIENSNNGAVSGNPRMAMEPLKEGSKEKDWGTPSWSKIKRMVQLGKSQIWKIVGATIALFIGSVANLALPKEIGSFIDKIGMSDKQAGMKEMTSEVWKLAILFTVIAITAWIRSTLFTMAGEKVVASLRKNLFDKLLTMEIAFYDINRTGELVNRLSSDTTLIQSAITTSVSQLLRNVALVIGGMVILITISWKLTLVMLVILPILGGISYFYGRWIKTLSKQVQDVLASATTVSEEALSSMRTVKSFGSEVKEQNKYHEKVDESYRVAKRRALIDGAFEATVGLVVNVCFGGVLFFGGWLVLKGEMTSGILTSYVLYVLQVAVGFVSLSSLFADFMRAMGASERVFDLLDRDPTIRFSGGIYPTTVHADGLTVQFNDVNFSYPSRLDHPVLTNLNLEIKPGKTLALVGPSGGGKSTIAHLLLGLYYPSSGIISIDSVDLTQLDPEFIRQNVSIVSQEPTLFATSIVENICYGVPESMFTSDQDKILKVHEAARMANAHDFIMSFPEGYETMVGERGIRLSGGQKQRIAIARALIKQPKILILDEATSALDSESEHLVKQALDKLLENSKGDKTFLVIAHRLSTVKNADSVAVIMKGQVVEQGTHDQLIKLDGTYKQLVSRQLSQD